MNQYDVFRQIGKAWATATRAILPVGYIKEGSNNPSTLGVFCRGWRRAKRRRLYRDVVRSAKHMGTA